MVNKSNSTKRTPSSQSRDKKRYGQVTEISRKKVEPVAKKKTVKKSKPVETKTTPTPIAEKPLDLSTKPAPKKYKVKTIDPQPEVVKEEESLNLQTVDQDGDVKVREGNRLIYYLAAAAILCTIAFAFITFAIANGGNVIKNKSSSSNLNEASSQLASSRDELTSSSKKSSSSSKSSSSKKESSEDEIDDILESMSVEQRAALILLSAPNGWDNHAFHNFTVNEIMSGSFAMNENTNMPFNGLFLKMKDEFGAQYFAPKLPANNRQISWDNSSTMNVFTRDGSKVNYGILIDSGKQKKMEIQYTVDMRDMYRQNGNNPNLQPLADKITPV